MLTANFAAEIRLTPAPNSIYSFIFLLILRLQLLKLRQRRKCW